MCCNFVLPCQKRGKVESEACYSDEKILIIAFSLPNQAIFMRTANLEVHQNESLISYCIRYGLRILTYQS